MVDTRGAPRPLAAAIVDHVVARRRTMPGRFPPGSDRGDTRALAALWT